MERARRVENIAVDILVVLREYFTTRRKTNFSALGLRVLRETRQLASGDVKNRRDRHSVYAGERSLCCVPNTSEFRKNVFESVKRSFSR